MALQEVKLLLLVMVEVGDGAQIKAGHFSGDNIKNWEMQEEGVACDDDDEQQ